MNQLKKPSSQMTSGELQKVFEESEIRRSHFFPRKVPSLSVEDRAAKSPFLSRRQKKELGFQSQEDLNTKAIKRELR